MWKIFLQPDSTQMATWRMHISCWVTKATDTNSEYVILVAFLPQQMLHERALSLRYTNFVCLITYSLIEKIVLSCLLTCLLFVLK